MFCPRFYSLSQYLARFPFHVREFGCVHFCSLVCRLRVRPRLWK